MNLLEPTWDGEVTLPDGTTARAAQLAAHAGAHRLGATLYELDPGAATSPLHFHHGNEELLFVLTGTPTLRTDLETERPLAPGEVVAFPAGRSGTHQVLNRTDAAVRVLICSTKQLPELAEQVETGTLVLLTDESARLVPSSAAETLTQP